MKYVKALRKRNRRRMAWENGPKHQLAGQGLKFHKPGSQNRRK